MRSEMKIGLRVAVAAVIAACVCIPVASAGDSTEIEFLWKPAADNSTEIYLHVMNTAWEGADSQVRKTYPKLRHAEWDYPVLTWMAHESGKSLSSVWKIRESGKSWTAVMKQLGIPRERLVLDLTKQHVPMGKAHGYWKKHSATGSALTDDDIYYWVNIHALSAYFEMAPGIIVTQREDGRTFKSLAVMFFNTGKGKAKQFHSRNVQSAGMDGEAPQKQPHRNAGARKKINDKN
jgi:hypothetical protein